MLTVREALKSIRTEGEISLRWDSCLHAVDPSDQVTMCAFGDYVVENISFFAETNSVEILIKIKPVKVGEVE